MAKIDGRTLNHKALEHIRILAVKRVIEDKEAPSEVMKSLGLCRTTIYPWLRKYDDEGMEALVERIAQGPEPKLTEKQRQQVKRWILGKDPRQYGFDFGLWSRRIVQALIEDKMGIDLGLTAVGRLLANAAAQARIAYLRVDALYLVFLRAEAEVFDAPMSDQQHVARLLQSWLESVQVRHLQINVRQARVGNIIRAGCAWRTRTWGKGTC